jgi:hypothetical protein
MATHPPIGCMVSVVAHSSRFHTLPSSSRCKSPRCLNKSFATYGGGLSFVPLGLDVAAWRVILATPATHNKAYISPLRHMAAALVYHTRRLATAMVGSTRFRPVESGLCHISSRLV